MSAAAFDRLVRAAARRRNAAFVGAVFHPDSALRSATPAQAVGFFRRAPDPTLQLVRLSVLDAGARPARRQVHVRFFDGGVGGAEEARARLPTSERIARDNHALAMRDGISTLQAIYDDIRADRQRSYGGG